MKNSDKQVTKLNVSVICSHTLKLLLGYVDTAPDEFSSARKFVRCRGCERNLTGLLFSVCTVSVFGIANESPCFVQT